MTFAHKLIPLVLLLISLTQCGGAECAATATFINDIDSDCVDDGTDNCVGVYNPNQLDSDNDGLGNACGDTSIGVPESEFANDEIFLQDNEDQEDQNTFDDEWTGDLSDQIVSD